MISIVIPVGAGDSPESVKATFTGADEVIEVREGSIPQAQNLGASKAKGDTLLFTECDMDLCGLNVQSLQGPFEIGGALIDTLVPGDKLHMMGQNYFAQTGSPWMMIGGFMWMKKYVWELLGGFRDTWWNDVEFASRAFWRGFRFGYFAYRVVHTRPLSPRFPYPEVKYFWGVP